MEKVFFFIFLGVFTILFSAFGVYALYQAFKHHEKDDRFFEDVGGGTVLFIVEIIIEGILWVIRKVFPERFYILAYRILAFLFGVLMFTLVGLVWYLIFGLKILN